MKYMLLIYMDEQSLSQTEREHCYQESSQYAQKLHDKGQFLGAGPCIRPPPRPASAPATASGS